MKRYEVTIRFKSPVPWYTGYVEGDMTPDDAIGITLVQARNQGFVGPRSKIECKEVK